MTKPIDRRRLTDVLHSAIQAKRSRVLVVAPESVRIHLAPSLAGLGIEYRWEDTAQGAARAGGRAALRGRARACEHERLAEAARGARRCAAAAAGAR